MATADGLEVRSLTTSAGELRVSLEQSEVPALGPDDVFIRMEAAPINPSDLGLLFGRADPATFSFGGSDGRPVVTGTIPPAALPSLAARLDQSMPVGNEGAGTVIDAGSGAEDWIGRTVAVLATGTYAQYRVAHVAQCVLLPPGTRARDGASVFVNPLSALGMIETMRREGHTALVHTAAASNLGQMLNRICLADGIELINVVRKDDQAAMLRALGAKHVVNSASPTFADELTSAILETGATLAFDAIGGGALASTILASMEVALTRGAETYSRYGSDRHKQVYVYGGLDTSRTELTRSYGMAWGIGGWLVSPRLQSFGAETVQRLRDRIIAELTTTFASHYTAEISLEQTLSAEAVMAYGRPKTGQKYLVVPNGPQVYQLWS